EWAPLLERHAEKGHEHTTREGNWRSGGHSWPACGRRTRKRVEDLSDGEGGGAAGAASAKKNPHVFALWKAPKPGEPETAAWDTPYGRGRRGWHLDSSAMSHRCLGESFDIQGGGLDLRFPHHENGQEQSRAAGYGF